MKNLAVLIVVLLFCSCKKDEPKSLIVINGVNQSRYQFHNSPTFGETVMIRYAGAEGKYLRLEKFPISYSAVQNVSSYQVTSTLLEDDIESIVVFLDFYYTDHGVSVINYQSETIPIHEGVNTYTITEKDWVNESFP